MSLESVPRDSVYEYILEAASGNRPNALPDRKGEVKVIKEKT